VEHAEKLFALAGDGWNVPERRIEIATAMLLSAEYFWTVYDDMLEVATSALAATAPAQPSAVPQAA
jgi:hypothetical protein